jgi:hypothetical protein
MAELKYVHCLGFGFYSQDFFYKPTYFFKENYPPVKIQQRRIGAGSISQHYSYGQVNNQWQPHS